VRLGLAVWLLAQGACDDGAPRATRSSLVETLAPAAPTRSVRFATFNAGLLPGASAYRRERARALAARLPTLGVDALCLQEVWLDDDWRLVSSAIHEALPTAIRPEASGGGCSTEETARIAACERGTCSDLDDEARAECLVGRCGRLATSLSPACLARLLGGTSGLGFATRLAISHSDVLSLDSTVEPRAAIHARLDDPALHVFCTHLTPAIALPGRTPEAATVEQARQIDRLLDWIDERTGDGAPVVLLGDLNTGPASDGGSARVPDHLARMLARGFVDPAASSAPRCTFCSDNPLVGGHGPGGARIDHTLLRGWGGRASVRRILDEPIALDGTAAPSRYSDHYGLELTLER
jgi:endonuclease/exonuclease/phosphatase family metal-dependent hydrolase